jgi:hypothetical protein
MCQMNNGNELQRSLSQNTNLSLAAGGARAVFRMHETVFAVIARISSSSSLREVYKPRRDGISGSHFISSVISKLQ